MKRLKPWLLPVMSLLTATALTALRQWQLSTAFDTDGVLISGRPATWALLAAVAVSALLWALGSRALAPCKALSSRRQMLPGLLTLLGALAIVCGSAMSLYWDLHQREILALAAACAGIIAALCLCVSAGAALQGKSVLSGLHIVPYLFLMIKLVSDFRSWSTDPVVWDYCFRHFALIFSLCGLYQFASFCFRAGKRRLTAFWAAGAVAFCAASVPGADHPDRLLYGGLALVLLAVLVQVCTAPAAEE